MVIEVRFLNKATCPDTRSSHGVMHDGSAAACKAVSLEQLVRLQPSQGISTTDKIIIESSNHRIIESSMRIGERVSRLSHEQ